MSMGGLNRILYFSLHGNGTMVRDFIFIRGGECRKTDNDGRCPMLFAALAGHLEIMQLLSPVESAKDDIRKQATNDETPLRAMALLNGHLEVVYWLLTNGALVHP